MQDTVARRMHDIQSFHVMALLAKAREMEAQGRDIVHMEIGEPDFDSPEPVIQAGIEALKAGHTHYTPALGLMALREKVAGYYKQRYGVNLDPRRVVITPGSSGALQLVMGVLVNPGNEVLLTDPGYPCNRNFVRLVEGVPVSFPVTADTDFQPTVDHIRRLWGKNTKALLIASPSNPTGTCIDTERLKEIARFISHAGGHLIMDEIYHGLEYGEQALPTALQVDDNAFVVNSFSKFFGMTGWRLGWLVAPEAFIPAIDKLAQNLFLAASTPAQHAALACFTPATLHILETRRRVFQKRRDFLFNALRELGFDLPAHPAGAFYIYANVARFTTDSFEWCGNLLDQQGVAVTPGIDFGRSQAAQYVRFAYTTDQARLEAGVERIRQFISNRS